MANQVEQPRDSSKSAPVSGAAFSTRSKQLLRAIAHLPRTIRRAVPKLWVSVYIIITLVGAELSLWWRPIFGVYMTGLALALLLGLALWYEKARSLAISAAIIPLALMVSLSLPQSSAFAQTVVFYDSLLVLGLVYRYAFTMGQPLPASKLSLKSYTMALPLMLVIGQLLGLIGYGLLRHFYGFGHTSLPLVAVTSVVFAIAEEVYFRGLLQQRASQLMHPALASVLTVIIFTSASLGHATILVPVVALIEGTVLCFTYYKKQNLLLTTAINAMSKLAYVGLIATFTLR